MYVDDVLIALRKQAEIGRLKRSLHDKFVMKELKQAQHILGMRIEQNWMTKTLQLSYSNYIQNVLKQFTMQIVEPAPTSLPTST